MVFFRRKFLRWGIDLGNRWIKGVQLKRVKKDLYIHRIGRFLWQRSDQEVKEKKAGKIRDFKRLLEFDGDEIITSISGHSVIIKILNFSQKNRKEIEENIKNRIEEYIPFDSKEIYFTYEIVEVNEGAFFVFLVASKKRVIDELKEICKIANLKISVIDVDSFALINCFEYNYPELVDKNIYLLDIGSQHSIFCVYSKKTPLFIRDLNFGGDEIVDKISSLMRASFLETEKHIISNFKEIGAQQRREYLLKVEEAIYGWSEEVLRTINFFKNSYKQDFLVDFMFLSGGGSLFLKTVDVFSKKIDTKVELLNPWKNIKYNEEFIDGKYIATIGPQFSIATGLALRSWI